jgi:IrrE N-terminal-like domain
VNRYRHKSGEERIWIEPAEMEDLMTAELTRAGLMPLLDDPVVDLESFVEQHLKVQLDQYAELAPNVLGETEFRVGAPLKMSINKDLTDAALDSDDTPPGVLGRYRATVAHESTHVIVHRCLFDLSGSQRSLFDDPEAAEPQVKHLQRCAKGSVLFRGTTSDWREIQANMGMACLLMPKDLFIAAYRQEMDRLKFDRVDKGSPVVATIVARLAPRFKVSRQAASIRVGTLELLTQPGQTLLPG